MNLWSFSYHTTYYITHPHKWFADLFRNTKFGTQRFLHGYDESMAWSIDWHLCELMPILLRQIRNNGIGTPVFDENISDAERETRWKEILDKIILGFESGYRIIDYDWNNKQEYDALMVDWSNGMDLFKEHFFDLWD